MARKIENGGHMGPFLRFSVVQDQAVAAVGCVAMLSELDPCYVDVIVKR